MIGTKSPRAVLYPTNRKENLTLFSVNVLVEQDSLFPSSQRMTPSPSSATQTAASKTQLNLNLQELLGDLFLVLTQKESEVI